MGPDIRRRFDAELSADQRQQIRLKLDSAGVRLLTYSAAAVPPDEAGCRRLVQFVRTMGMETIVCNPPRQLLDLLEGLCDEYDVRLALAARTVQMAGILMWSWRPAKAAAADWGPAAISING